MQVLRPICPSNKTYCPSSKTCCPIDYKLLHQLNENDVVCGMANFRLVQENCSLNSDPVPLFDQYALVFNISLSVTVGYNLKKLSIDETFEYLPGDIMGLLNSPGGATIAVDSSHGAYSVWENIVALSDKFVIDNAMKKMTTGNILLSGIALRKSEFTASIAPHAVQGLKNIVFTYSTKDDTVKVLKSVSVLNLVGNVSFVTATNSCFIYGPLNEEFMVSLTFQNGTNATVSWRINNVTTISSPYLKMGNQEEMTDHQNFTLTSLGEHLLVVVVANGLNGRLLTTTVIVQEKIKGVNAGKLIQNSTIYQGFDTQLSVKVMRGTNVTYKWYFGDGSDVVTSTNNTIAHAYLKSGRINTTVEALNMVSAVNATININVTNPVKVITPTHIESNVSTNITCSLKPENSPLVYVTILQIDEEYLAFSNCSTIEITLTPGLHHIHCHIEFGIAMHARKTVYVIERIQGLSILDVPPLKVNSSYMVKANISAGSNVTYLWQVYDETYSNFLNSSQSIVFSKRGNGRVNLKLNASNVLSMVSKEIVVIVQESIEKLRINASQNPAKANLTIFFEISKDSGTEVNYTISITKAKVYVYDKELGPNPNFSYTFSKEGWYDALVLSKNLISTSNATYSIAVQEPIKSNPKIKCRHILLSDATYVVPTNEPISFTAEITYATNVSFEWKWRENDVDVDKSPESNNASVISTKEKTFQTASKFLIFVTAKNNISSKYNSLAVESLHKISGFSFYNNNITTINTDVEIVTTMSKGSNVSYAYTFGDGNSSITNSPVTNHSYSNVGKFLIECNASNLLSSEIFSRSIVVQKKITAVDINPIRPQKTGHKVEIRWNVTDGIHPLSDVNFDDGHTATVNHTYCDEYNFGYRCRMKYTWSKLGEYQLFIKSYNLVSSKNSRITVIIQDGILNFSVDIENKTTYYMNTKISVKYSTNSRKDVNYEIKYDNKIEKEETDFIKYTKEGSFIPQFRAKNLVSETEWVNGSNVEVIVVKKPREPEKIVNLTMSVKPTKFGEVTKFKFDYQKGALFSCKMNYGDKTTKSKTESEVNEGISHEYKETGDFNAEITCINKHGKEEANATAYVHVPIEEFKINNSFIREEFQKEITVLLEWLNGSNLDVTYSTKHDYNDDEGTSNIIKLNFEGTSRTGKITLGKDYFAEPGLYLLSVNASNRVSSLDELVTAKIEIVESIKGVEILVNEFVSVGYKFRAYLLREKGSDITVTWDFDDGTPKLISNCTWKESCYMEHEYKESGNYLISAFLQNSISKYSTEKTINILYPIRGWELKQVGIGRENDLTTLKMYRNNSFHFPTNATYSIRFDEKKEFSKEKTLTNGELVQNSTYMSSGCFLAEVKMRNKVSSVSLEAKVKVRGQYSKARINIESLKPDNLKASTSSLPLEYPVKFSSNINNTCLKYNWTVIGRKNETFALFHSVFFVHTFNETGKYRVKFLAYDSDDKKENVANERDFFLDYSVSGLYFSGQGVGKVNKTTQFILLWATKGKDTSFKIDYGDETIKEELDVHHPTTVFKNYVGQIPFDPKGLNGIVFNHNFTKDGKFKVNLTVDDGKNSLVTYMIISKDPCPPPNIKIHGGHQNALKAPKIPFEVEYLISSSIETTKCSSDIKIDFNWRIFKADEYLLNATGLSVIPPNENLELK